jgi:hypothetical protein
VLVLFANSDHLLHLVQQRGLTSLLRDPSLRYRLGWFWRIDGTAAWGIELTNRDHDINVSQAAGARFLTNSETATMAMNSDTSFEKDEEVPSRKRGQCRWWHSRRKRYQGAGRDSMVALVAPRRRPIQGKGLDPDVSERARTTLMTNSDANEISQLPPVQGMPTYHSSTIPRRKPVPGHRHSSFASTDGGGGIDSNG